MTTATGDKIKRPSKRLDADTLKERIKERMKKDEYKGVDVDNVVWNTLDYDPNLRRQFVIINTVDENGKPDGNTRRVATSDLQHVKHTKEVTEAIKRKRSSERRASKRTKKTD